MSAVTTILLAVGSEEDENLVPDLNARLRALGWDDWVLRNLGDGFGGDKVPEPLFGGAVKYFDLRVFAAAVRETPWRDPDDIQVMLNGERPPCEFRWVLFSLDELVRAAEDEMTRHATERYGEALEALREFEE